MAHSRLHRAQTRNIRTRSRTGNEDVDKCKKPVKSTGNSVEAGVRLYERGLSKQREKELRVEAILEEEENSMFHPKINLISSYLTTDKNEEAIPIEDRLILHGELYNRKSKIREEMVMKMEADNSNSTYLSSTQPPRSPEKSVPIHAKTTGKLKIEVPNKKEFKKTTDGKTHPYLM